MSKGSGAAETRAVRRVLIVEDEWLIAHDLQFMLEDAGYRVIGPASSVAAALDLVEREAVDGALLDLDLNDEWSYPVAEALRARGAAFAFLTGHAAADIQPEFRGEALIGKPVREDDLLRRLAELLERGVLAPAGPPGAA